MTVVTFKSSPGNWAKEHDGRKPNTVRKVDTDARFETLKEWSETGVCGLIEVVNTQTRESFHRQVTDVTFWADCVIISWRHAP